MLTLDAHAPMTNPETLLSDWLVRAKRKTNAHTASASRFEFLHLVVGIPSVMLSAVTGTAVVAQQTAKEPGDWTWWIVLLVVAAAILTSLQTFLNFGARAKHHKTIAAEFSVLRRKLQFAIDTGTSDKEEIKQLGEMFDDITADEPIIPSRIWREVEKKYPRS